MIFELVNKPSAVYGFAGISLVPEDLLLIEDDLTSDRIETALGYTPENVANKAVDFTTVDNTVYPTTQAVVDYFTNNNQDKNYVHTQSTASSTWNITHPLNKLPSVMVIDSANSEVWGEINYIDNNNITLSFTGAFSGKAILN